MSSHCITASFYSLKKIKNKIKSIHESHENKIKIETLATLSTLDQHIHGWQKNKKKNKHQAHSHTDKLAKSTSREQHYRERSLWRESQRAQKKLTAKHKHGEWEWNASGWPEMRVCDLLYRWDGAKRANAGRYVHQCFSSSKQVSHSVIMLTAWCRRVKRSAAWTTRGPWKLIWETQTSGKAKWSEDFIAIVATLRQTKARMLTARIYY